MRVPQRIRALLMIRPAKFAYNPQTAATNSFQQVNTGDVHEQALAEFDQATAQLRDAGFTLEVIADDPASPLPDSVFPNNWFSTHEQGKLVLYPMLTPNRRAERKKEIIDLLRTKYRYHTVCDYSFFEAENAFLEGTGSMVFDHEERIAFACISPRTDRDVLLEACGTLGYIPFVFAAYDRNNLPVYHTNVMMALGPGIAVCCFESVHDKDDQYGLRRFMQLTGKTTVEISLAQMESFAGNMLFIENEEGRLFVAVSDTAWSSLSAQQKSLLSSKAEPLIFKIPTIEKHGGGSIRCMLAELY